MEIMLSRYMPCTYKLAFKIRKKKKILIEVMYQEAVKTVLKLHYISFLLKIKVKVRYFLLVSTETTAAIIVLTLICNLSSCS